LTVVISFGGEELTMGQVINFDEEREKRIFTEVLHRIQIAQLRPGGPEAMILRMTMKEMEEMAAHLIKLRQEPEFDLQAKIFIKGMGHWRICLENYLKKLGD
jgi:hypothetical protein